MKTILFLSASPSDQESLKITQEYKKIKKNLERSSNYSIVYHPNTTGDDLQSAIVRCRPAIVHFAGHGENGLVLCGILDQTSKLLIHQNL